MRVDNLSAFTVYEAPSLRATPELYLKPAGTPPPPTPKNLSPPETKSGEANTAYEKVQGHRELVTINLPDRIRQKVTPPKNESDDGDYYDVRRIAPRETSELSMALYVEGVLSWDEHSMLAFQPELHPDYEATIGALTGKEAEPDRPRDLVKLWEEKLSFELRHADQSAVSRKNLATAQKIASVLRLIDQPVDMVA
jgi:hypothetical protein